MWPNHLNYPPTDEQTHAPTDPATMEATWIPPSELLTKILTNCPEWLHANQHVSSPSYWATQRSADIPTHQRTNPATHGQLTNHFQQDMTDHHKLSPEPNWPSDYDRKDDRDTKREQTAEGVREADASASERHKESSEIVETSPSHWVRLSKRSLSLAAHGNIRNVSKKGFPFLPSVFIMDIPVEPICTNRSLV